MNDRKSDRRATCSHQWVDLLDPPIARAPYSPIVGDGRRQMKPGRRYECRDCGATIIVECSTRNT